MACDTVNIPILHATSPPLWTATAPSATPTARWNPSMGTAAA